MTKCSGEEHSVQLPRDLGSVISGEGSKPEIFSRKAQTTAALTRLKQFEITGVFLSVPRYD